MPTSSFITSIGVDEKLYKADLEILDRYQKFSAELLRMALLGVSGYGFLITNIIFKENVWKENNRIVQAITGAQCYFIVGLIALGVTTAAALAHRYYSTDCVTHLVMRIRLTQQLDNLPVDDPRRHDVEKKTDLQKYLLKNDFRTSARLFVVASSALFVGVVCVAMAFIKTISTFVG